MPPSLARQAVIAARTHTPRSCAADGGWGHVGRLSRGGRAAAAEPHPPIPPSLGRQAVIAAMFVVVFVIGVVLIKLYQVDRPPLPLAPSLFLGAERVVLIKLYQVGRRPSPSRPLFVCLLPFLVSFPPSFSLVACARVSARACASARAPLEERKRERERAREVESEKLPCARQPRAPFSHGGVGLTGSRSRPPASCARPAGPPRMEARGGG